MKNDELYIAHILGAIEKIEQYLRDVSVGDFLAYGMLFDAVCRELGIIGEAANNLSPAFQEKHNGIPWKKIIGLRNVLVHEYFGVSAEILWETCQRSLPDLKKSLQSLRPE